MLQGLYQLFPTIMEEPDVMFRLLESHFAFNKFLFDDMVRNHCLVSFKQFILDKFQENEEREEGVVLDPFSLFKSIGYTLYECRSDADIQRFRHYYQKKEELCTFSLKRLEKCYVFFAVHQDALKICRDDFLHPLREDLYGVSVLSIQFSKDGTYSLSIKNRYNHTVHRPDATFSNNLDCIVPGLKKSFRDYYGFFPVKGDGVFKIPGYVLADDSRYYPYYFEKNNIYYCCNNVIVDHYHPYHYDGSKYLIIDYFILNLEDKKIEVYDQSLRDSFLDFFSDIWKIEIFKNKENQTKEVLITLSSLKRASIFIDQHHQMIGYSNDFLDIVGDNFLAYSKNLKEVDLPNLRKVGDNFLCFNEGVENIFFPLLLEVGNNFFFSNVRCASIELPMLYSWGKNFFYWYDKEIEKKDILVRKKER